jgi:hypothetical protein
VTTVSVTFPAVLQLRAPDFVARANWSSRWDLAWPPWRRGGGGDHSEGTIPAERSIKPSQCRTGVRMRRRLRGGGLRSSSVSDTDGESLETLGRAWPGSRICAHAADRSEPAGGALRPAHARGHGAQAPNAPRWSTSPPRRGRARGTSRKVRGRSRTGAGLVRVVE